MHLSLWFLEAGFVGVKSSGNEDDHFDRLSQVREAIRQKRCEERGQTYIPPNEVSGTQEYVIQVSAKSATQNLVFSKIGSSWQKINAMLKCLFYLITSGKDTTGQGHMGKATKTP